MFSKPAKLLQQKILRQIGTIKEEFTITDIKNDHLVYVQDPNGKLPFMKQVITDKGQRGIVLKLQSKSISVVGFYNNIQKTQTIKIQEIKSRSFEKFPLQFNKTYDIHQNQIAKAKDIYLNPKFISEPEIQGKKVRIPLISPVLSSCYNMFYGDFTVFSGSLGSGRTTNSLAALNYFVHQNQNMGIYLNPNVSAKNDNLNAISCPNTISFGRFSQQKPLTSVGIYMLTVKTLEIAKRYKNQGHNIMLIVDNINQILANEWSILQNLNLPISPISILNQLYSESDFSSKSKKGSLTTIGITASDEGDSNIIQELTNFTNNPKHLKTLSQHIEHPLKFQFNYNSVSNRYVNGARQCINKLLKEKKQSELVRKLKIDKEEPWEYYYILDSQWWAKSVKTYQPYSVQQRDLFLWFLTTNIQNDLCAFWNIPCIDAYRKYLEYLGGSDDFKAGIDEQQFQNFMHLAKMQGFLSVFKRDYLQ